LDDCENEIANTLKTAPFAAELARMREMMLSRTDQFFLAIRKKKGYPMRDTGAGQARN
jgi:hypothetical protein